MLTALIFLFTFCRANAFVLEDLSTILSQNMIKSPTQLLEQLPPEYRANFLLMYASRSRQYPVEPWMPRIVTYGREAQLVLGFSGEGRDPDSEHVEVIANDPRTGESRFFRIAYEPESKRMVMRPGQDCHSCHSAELHMNWEPFSLWPGAFGSSNISHPDLGLERQHFAKFLNEQAAHGRYRSLGIDPTSFHLRQMAQANSRFSDLVSHWNGLRLITRLERMVERGEADASELFAALYLTGEKFGAFLSLPGFDAKLKDTEEKMIVAHENNVKRALKNLGLKELTRDFVNHNLRHAPEIASLRLYVEDKLGLSTRSWSPTKDPDTYAFASANTHVIHRMLRHYTEWLKSRPGLENVAARVMSCEKDLVVRH